MTYLPSQGGVTPTVLDLTPDTTVSYDGSSGTLVGDVAGGILEGWKVNNWAGFTGIEENAGGYVDLQGNESGNFRMDILNGWLTDAPYIYLDCDPGDLYLQILTQTAGGGNLAQPAHSQICIGWGHPDNLDKTYDHINGMAWGSWTTSTGKFEAVISRPGTSPNGFVSGAAYSYAAQRSMRVERVDARCRWLYDNAAAWSELLGAGGRDIDVGGAVCRLCIGLGGNASPMTDTFRIFNVKASYTPFTP